MVEEAKAGMDVIAVSTTVASIATWLPPTASLITIIWMIIRIWETDTVRALLSNKKDK